MRISDWSSDVCSSDLLSAGTPGGTRMLHHKAEQLGQFRLALHRPDASVPKDSIAAVIDRLGPIPPHEIPSLTWLTYATDAYLGYIEPELAPDVMILWYCEPDNSYPYRGIGTDANLAAPRPLDTALVRIPPCPHPPARTPPPHPH